MEVIRGFSTNTAQPITSPFPINSGIFLEFRGGNFVYPYGKGNWFTPPIFTKAIKFFLKYPILPYISWRFGKKGGYIGAKAFGVDSETYKNFVDNKDVYDGSVAIMLSIRPFATLKD